MACGAEYTLAHDEEDIPLRDRRAEYNRVSNSATDASALEDGILSARASRTNLTDEADDNDLSAASEDEVELLGNEKASNVGIGDKAGIILVRIMVLSVPHNLTQPLGYS